LPIYFACNVKNLFNRTNHYNRDLITVVKSPYQTIISPLVDVDVELKDFL